jgi:hypothetical protein
LEPIFAINLLSNLSIETAVNAPYLRNVNQRWTGDFLTCKSTTSFRLCGGDLRCRKEELFSSELYLDGLTVYYAEIHRKWQPIASWAKQNNDSLSKHLNEQMEKMISRRIPEKSSRVGPIQHSQAATHCL